MIMSAGQGSKFSSRRRSGFCSLPPFFPFGYNRRAERKGEIHDTVHTRPRNPETPYCACPCGHARHGFHSRPPLCGSKIFTGGFPHSPQVGENRPRGIPDVACPRCGQSFRNLLQEQVRHLRRRQPQGPESPDSVHSLQKAARHPYHLPFSLPGAPEHRRFQAHRPRPFSPP